VKTIRYQIERQTPKGGWETLAPTVTELAEAGCLLRAHEIIARHTKTGGVFRLVKTVRTVVRA